MTVQLDTFAEWFAAELDARLAAMPAAERDGWLRSQERAWICRYADFIGSRGESEANRPHPLYGAPNARDFDQFMRAIRARLNRAMAEAA